jgi:hypothetical protein
VAGKDAGPPGARAKALVVNAGLLEFSILLDHEIEYLSQL